MQPRALVFLQGSELYLRAVPLNLSRWLMTLRRHQSRAYPLQCCSSSTGAMYFTFALFCSVAAGSLPALRRTQSGRVVNLPSHHPEAEQFDSYAALGPAPSARGSARASSGSFSAGRSAGGPVIAITNATDVPSPPPSHFSPDDPFEMGFEQVDRESKLVRVHAMQPVISLVFPFNS